MSMQILITVLAVAATLFIAYWRFSCGCYGKLRPSSEATVAYESFRVIVSTPPLDIYPMR
ncbi:MAG: hypothetical protein NTY86_01285 [Deltaproteobacteria bacterium]|nr:hypothetical protein [Deltaproteobacteria bacterium]